MANISEDQYLLPNFVIFYLGLGMIQRIMQVTHSELQLQQQQQQAHMSSIAYKCPKLYQTVPSYYVLLGLPLLFRGWKVQGTCSLYSRMVQFGTVGWYSLAQFGTFVGNAGHHSQQVFLTGSFKPLAGGLVTATLGKSGLQTSKLPEEQE